MATGASVAPLAPCVELVEAAGDPEFDAGGAATGSEVVGAGMGLIVQPAEGSIGSPL